MSSNQSPEKMKKAESLLHHTNSNWLKLLAGNQGFLTDESWRGLDRHAVQWGEMVSLLGVMLHNGRVSLL